MRLLLMESICILLIISFNLNPSFSILYKHIKKIEKQEKTEKQTRCLQVAAENFFLSLHNLYVVGEKVEDPDIYQFLYKYFSFIRESTTNFESKSVKRYIIIEDDIPLVTYMFWKLDFSTWSEYLILTKTSFENLSKLADHLYNLTFIHVAFLLVDDADDVTVYQFNARPTYENEGILVEVAKCDDYFLIDKDAQKSLRPFKQVLCPVSGCTLSYWRLITDTPNTIIYKVYENGTSFTKSMTGRRMKLFADHYKIQKIQNENETNIDMSWKDAAQAVMNRTVDVLYGYILPEAKDVEDLAIMAQIAYNYVGMMYVQKVRPTPSTGLENIFAPLDIQIWIYLIVVLLFYGLFLCAVEKIREQRLIRESLHASDLLRIFLKQDIVPPTNGGLRIVVGIIFVFALLLTMFYESTITSSFIVRIPSVQLETLDDLVKSDCRFGGPKFIRRFFKHYHQINGTMNYIYNKYEVASTEEIIQMMHNEGVVMMHSTIVLNILKLNSHQNYSYYLSKKPVIGYPALLFTSKGHPYTSALKDLVLRTDDSAIASKLNQGITSQEMRSSGREKFSPLTQEQLAFCWNILIIGWSTSLVVFLAESIAFRLKIKRR